MKMTKRILGILLACVMLFGAMPLAVAADDTGSQANPINANDKWFGWGVDCFLMNTTLEAGDADGIWYELTADAAGILQVEHSYYDVDYQITVNVNGQEYLGYENGVYNMPIATLPVAVGDVISIHIIARDTALGGTVYCNAKFITGANDQTQTVKLKGANGKVWVANGATVYFQDDSLQAAYAAKGLELASSATEGITVISGSKTYTDTDGDGIVELVLGGSAGSAGAPPVKPSFAIVNGSGADAWFVLNVADTAHECVYDNDADADCNSCGAIRDLTCQHSYSYNCDKVCALCGEETRPEAKHDYDIGCATNCIWCGQLTNPDAACVSDAEYPCQDGYCIYCLTAMPATATHTYDNDYDADCNVCGEVRLVEYQVLTFEGNSISEDVSGLAFGFKIVADDIAIQAGKKTQADYTNATVIPNSQSDALKLVGMGAVVSNNGSFTDLDYVDGKNVIDVPAVYLYDLEPDAAMFTVRILNIPESDYETFITARPYYIYQTATNEQIVVYGEEEFSSYNNVRFNG